MRVFHKYSKADGTFTGKSSGARNPASLALPDTEEFGWVEGVTDWRAQRVDLKTGDVVDYQPPAPSKDHEWDGKRWVVKPEIKQEREESAEAIEKIRELEAQQHRRVRELLAATDPALKALDDQIAALRPAIIAKETSEG
jgi:hypothetical protein